jgi:hypothetical protein
MRNPEICNNNKQLRSQFAAHTCKHILEQDNFFRHIFFTYKQKFYISGRVNYCNFFIFVSERPTDHLEYERDSPNVTVNFTLIHEEVIGPCLFDENIITRNSFVSPFGSSVTIIMLILNWTTHLFIVITLFVTGKLESYRSMNVRNRLSSSFS